MRSAPLHLVEIVLLGGVLVLTLRAYSDDGRLALDVHNETYRQADAVVHGRDVYEPPGDLSDRSSALWPIAAVLPLVLLASRRRGAWLALAAALFLSPIVWRHFLTLLIVPLALLRPPFDAVRLIPIGPWVGHGTLNGALWQTAGVLALVTLTFMFCESRPNVEKRSMLTPGRPVAEV